MKTKIKKPVCILCAIVFVALALCSCGAKISKGARAADMAAYEDVRFDNAAPQGGAADYGYSKAQSVFDAETAEENADTKQAFTAGEGDYNAIADASSRKMIRDASLDIETEKYDDFIASLNKAITQAGGFVQFASESGDNYNYTSSRYQQMEIRVPAEKLDAFLGSVSSLATITSKQISVKEITGEYINTQSRIKALETEYEALLKILEKASKVEDLISIQERLTNVNAELEKNKTALKTYDEQIAYSTVTMSISEVERVTKTQNRTFGQELKSRLSDNLYNISQGARSFAIWFISSLPYILIFAVTAAAVAVAVFKIRKHRKTKAKKPSKQSGSEDETHN